MRQQRRRSTGRADRPADGPSRRPPRRPRRAWTGCRRNTARPASMRTLSSRLSMSCVRRSAPRSSEHDQRARLVGAELRQPVAQQLERGQLRRERRLELVGDVGEHRVAQAPRGFDLGLVAKHLELPVAPRHRAASRRRCAAGRRPGRAARSRVPPRGSARAGSGSSPRTAARSPTSSGFNTSPQNLPIASAALDAEQLRPPAGSSGPRGARRRRRKPLRRSRRPSPSPRPAARRDRRSAAAAGAACPPSTSRARRSPPSPRVRSGVARSPPPIRSAASLRRSSGAAMRRATTTEASDRDAADPPRPATRAAEPAGGATPARGPSGSRLRGSPTTRPSGPRSARTVA